MMKHQEFIHKSIYLVVLVLGLLAGCQAQMLPTPIGSSPTPISPVTLFPTPVPSPTLTQVAPSPTPTTHYQLTFMSECREESQCMNAIDMGCLESEQPCISEPQLLFEISKQSQGPRPPILKYDWSPDGQKVAIEAPGLRGKGDIFVGDWGGQDWINLTNSPNYEGGPVWSPDGLHITFDANSGEPDYKVRPFWVTPYGKEIVQILETLDISGIQQLSWSLDGKHLAFVHSDANGYSQIYVAHTDGSNFRQLTDQMAAHFQPDFSPDGQWIVASREADRYAKVNELILIPLNSSEKMGVILRFDGYIFTPVWSPIGDWIAFTSEVDGHSAIYLIRSDGTGLTRVTRSNADEFAPAWRILSP
jgi:Tol biopolymer transport system component